MIAHKNHRKYRCMLFAIGLCLFVSFATCTRLLYAEDKTAYVWPKAFKKKLDWKFSDEDIRLFSPPLDATIKEMLDWVEQLTQPMPEDTDEWGGPVKYRDRVARLRGNIFRQILATKPDDKEQFASVLMERIDRRIAATNDTEENVEKRFHLYMLKRSIITAAWWYKFVTDEDVLAFAGELEAQTGKDEHHSGYLQMLYDIYYSLLYHEFDNLIKNDTITDEALAHIFTSARRTLHTESSRGHGGLALDPFPDYGNRLFDRLTPEQRVFYARSFEELYREIEKVETEWLAAGKPMTFLPTVLPYLRNHLAEFRLLGREIALTGTTLDGQPFDLTSLRGKIVLLDFWATWCAPCIAELPELQKRYEEYHARGFEIVAISIDDEEDKGKLVEFVRARQLPWIQLHEPGKELYKMLHAPGVPYCPLLDRDGKVILQDAHGETLKQKLAEIFE